ncbi:MAG TPA: DUF3500 domain-containing protein [Phenylobacterium sp.]|nr:DUF3500 domain-containing protein [Phenylobacterium sp.]
MSTADYSRYVDPAKAPPLTKAACRMSLEAYAPFLERLLGVWAPLSREPFRGITAEGTVIEGLSGFRSEGAPVAAAAEAAGRWLASLPPALRAKACFPVDSDLWRHWQNTPLLLRDPQVELIDLPMPLRELALEIVRVSLSAEGYRRTREVMANNLFLGGLVGMTDVLNDWAFTLSIFGTPSTVEPWGWQLFGHHLALNCMFIGDQMVLSPVFMGVEPDRELGPEHRRLFEPHETHALRLMTSLSDAERTKAVLYGSMLTADQPPARFHPDDGRQLGGAFRDNRIVPYEGLPVGSLDRQQKRLLLQLAELFVGNMPDGPAEARMRDIERHLQETHFAWIGPADEVNPFYFRIHSPVALIEFDHHSGVFLANEDPARFHVHTIVRTPNGGDYGFDLLRRHYAQGGHDRGAAAHSHDAHSHDGGHTFHRHD